MDKIVTAHSVHSNLCICIEANHRLDKEINNRYIEIKEKTPAGVPLWPKTVASNKETPYGYTIMAKYRGQ